MTDVKQIILAILILSISISSNGKNYTSGGVYDVHKYGAIGDGVTDDAAKIQKAIDAASRNGGGKVLIKNGTFLISTIILKSNIELYLAGNAILLGYPKDFRKYFKDDFFLYKKMSRALIYANGATNIAIKGDGKIDGQGKSFSLDSDRPNNIFFRSCKGVQIEGVSMVNAGCFNCWLIECENVRINRVRIENLAQHNNDALDLDACKDVMISNSYFHSLDDCITLKSTIPGSACRDIIITNCNFSTKCAAIRIGPDAYGNIENVAVSNCVIRNTLQGGIKIQQSFGGTMQNMTFSDIVMDNVVCPIVIRVAGWQEITKGMKNTGLVDVFDDSKWESGKVQNISFSNIVGTVPKIAPKHASQAKCIQITGTTKTRPRNISFNNINIRFSGGGTEIMGARRDVPDLPRNYPEIGIFGILPAYGLYAHHASDIILNNVQFRLDTVDMCPAIVCNDVENLEISGFKAEGNERAESLIRLEDTRNVLITSSRTLNMTGSFLRVEGTLSEDILLQNNKLNLAKKIFDISDNVNKGAVIIK